MKKLNGFDNWLIVNGLELVKKQMLKEINEATAKGKNHIFSANYVEYIVKDATDKINALTLKNKQTK